MRYTTLRVSEAGVVLYAGHVERLRPEGPGALAAFDRFAREARPGVYAVTAEGAALRVERRAGSALTDGMPVRFAVSPVAGKRGVFPKPAPPSPYDAVRAPGVATLLTSPDGAEIYESCIAAAVGWDGARFVCVPEDRPRVDAIAEAAVRAAAPCARAPIFVRGDLPLVLLNAVAGPWAVAAGRPPFPPAALALLREILESSARRGGAVATARRRG
jgi:hypothetical protein